jgi:3D (Asp-Asp-Asp) domain-containing protein
VAFAHRAPLLVLLFAAPAGASPSLSEPDVAPDDRSKGALTSDLDERDAKLPRLAKVKECCGYPIAERDGFRLSFYWLAYESEYANEKYDVDIYDRTGFWIGRYPSAFVFELKLEGTGFLRDGRLLNYAGPCTWGIGTCFDVLEPDEHPLGRGVQNRRLDPFRSVAVDPRRIPIGSPIFVPEIVGMELPDGTRHDGCLRADDQGGAIKGGKLDFFVESYFNFKYLADQLWWHLKATPHLDEPRCEYLRLGDPREHDNERADWALLRARAHEKRPALALKREAMRPVARKGSKRGPTLANAVAEAPRRGAGQAVRRGKQR